MYKLIVFKFSFIKKNWNGVVDGYGIHVLKCGFKTAFEDLRLMDVVKEYLWGHQIDKIFKSRLLERWHIERVLHSTWLIVLSSKWWLIVGSDYLSSYLRPYQELEIMCRYIDLVVAYFCKQSNPLIHDFWVYCAFLPRLWVGRKVSTKFIPSEQSVHCVINTQL